jgi:general stress protein 26
VAVGGVYVGSQFHDHPVLRYVFVMAGVAPDEKNAPAANDVDRADPASVLAAAVRLANRSGGLALLATATAKGEIHARVMQPLPVTINAQGEPQIIFHSTVKSRKTGELLNNPECAVVFLNPREQTCVSFVGAAARCGKKDEDDLAKTWPLFPPLSLFYPGKTIKDFGAWRLKPRSVEVVSPGMQLVTKGREDWRSPEVAWNETDGVWEFKVQPAV